MTGVRLLLDDPHACLTWLAAARRTGRASLARVDVAHVYAVAALAALVRRDGKETLALEPTTTESGAARFAHAIGLDEVVVGDVERDPVERERTVSLTRVKGRGPKEAISEKIVRLLLPREPE